MAMKRCPICGEKYSDTYESCPFCEEEEALGHGEEIRRSASRSGKRAAKRSSQPSLLSPILIGLIILMVCLLIYLIFGDKIKEKLAGDDPANKVEEVVPPVDQEPADNAEGDTPEDGVMPGEDGETEDPAVTEPNEVDYESLPTTLTVNNPDFTLKVGDSYTVSVKSGGSGSYTWVSSDDGIASVDDNGKVIAISNGKITLTVYDEKGKGTATVYVKGGTSVTAPTTPTTTTTTTTPSGGENKLNRTDMTLSVAEKFQLKLTGVTTALSWSSADSGVASVASDGTVTGVAPGKTTITVSWDGASKSCIVYVKK